MATSSIGFQLGIGSGLDVKSLVEDLAAAAKGPKEALLKKREDANAAKVSTLASVSNAIDSFASALTSLISGGTLYSQPSVSNTNIFTASALPGSRIGGLSASITVEQLAQAQTLSSASLAARTAPVGEGTLTLTVGGASHDITIDASNNSLDGLAKAINDKNTGVKASVVTDASGARLVLKGATGAANAFTLTVPGGTTSGLERFASAGMTVAQSAQDAILNMDGVTVTRASNSFSDLIEGVQIDLKQASPGTLVSVGVSRPTAAITQGVQDFVAAYNELMGMIAEATAAGVEGDGGALRGDLGVREMQRQLRQISTMTLSSSGAGPKTLAEIGVRTNRDGTLSVDAVRLQEMLANDPDGVEALFNPTQSSSSPFVTIKSGIGKVKPGTYTITDIVPASGDTPASGKINGVAMTGIGGNLVAPAGSDAVGLILGVSGTVSSVTITIDPGLGGALQGIRDSLRARSGPFAGTEERLSAEAKKIAEDRETLETRSEKYYNQLLTTFTNMERQVSSFKATQSYLDQQIKMWTNSND
ncbi:flagellar filament capping protein FliD [Sphingosinicella sp. LHD-64]|uniref:flagellar filament capping protein FliD n=1 Tax=Sphingosinicella sp. LHD-64 TaxID=3072139 RepID=UPI00280F2C6C|nr:flagellar filament capping protein FliD [Sphingosinicella sp. LHD-64]MDQ8757153.1 flagellar filament capping protein FliD [Sphingosinicella sp. LHD-64]